MFTKKLYTNKLTSVEATTMKHALKVFEKERKFLILRRRRNTKAGKFAESWWNKNRTFSKTKNAFSALQSKCFHYKEISILKKWTHFIMKHKLFSLLLHFFPILNLKMTGRMTQHNFNLQFYFLESHLCTNSWQVVMQWQEIQKKAMTSIFFCNTD